MTASDHYPVKVSIGMPVYNGERYVSEAIRCILDQTFKDFELIISDNASTDETVAICEEFARKDERIRIYRQDKNYGAAWNHNFTFKKARGEYFRWFATDDKCDPALLEKCVSILDTKPNNVLCCTKVAIIDADGNLVEECDENMHLQCTSRSIRYVQCIGNSTWGHAFYGLIRSDALRQTSLIQSFVHSEHVMVGRLSLLGDFFEVPDYLFFRRMHPGQYSGGDKGADGRLEWFDSSLKGRAALPLSNLFLQHILMVSAAPIPLKSKFFPVLFMASQYSSQSSRIKKELKYFLSFYYNKRPKLFRR